MDNISGGDPERLKAFSNSVEGSSSFIDLIVENDNEEAWEWLIEYVSDQCQTSNYCEPHSGSSKTNNEARELVFFCKTFRTAPPANIRTLVESEYFNDTYVDFIEGLNKCGTDNEQCRGDQHADFIGDVADDNTVCQTHSRLF